MLSEGWGCEENPVKGIDLFKQTRAAGSVG